MLALVVVYNRQEDREQTINHLTSRKKKLKKVQRKLKKVLDKIENLWYNKDTIGKETNRTSRGYKP